MRLKYKIDTENEKLVKRRWKAYLALVRSMDFSKSPDLPKYFVYDFFHDGEFKRFELDFNRSLLIMELESIEAWCDIFDQCVQLGLPRAIHDHRCEDFIYTCTFYGVVYFAVEHDLIEVETETGEVRYEFWQPDEDAYRYGEIMDSPLRQRLCRKLKRDLFHLRMETHAARYLDIVFEKVVVRKKNKVRLEKYTGGRRVVFRSLFNG